MIFRVLESRIGFEDIPEIQLLRRKHGVLFWKLFQIT